MGASLRVDVRGIVMRLSDTFERKELTVIEGKDGGEGLVITYAPEAITPKHMRALKAMSKEKNGEAEDAIATLLTSVGLAWNLTDEDGTPIPATPEGWDDKVGLRTLFTIWNAIQEDQAPNAPS